MDRFFKHYSPEQRQKVETSQAYQNAAKEKNAIKAAEIAVTILEGSFDRRIGRYKGF